MVWRDRDGAHEAVRRVEQLRVVMLDVVPGQGIGYATDLRFTDANARTLVELPASVERLCIVENVFLHADLAQAQRKDHLTARQAGAIAPEFHADTPLMHPARPSDRCTDRSRAQPPH